MLPLSKLCRSGPNNFDALRLSMALAVVWSHSFALYFGTEAWEPICLMTNGVTNAGRVGVYVFFVISGFLITQSFERSTSSLNFLIKRIARIYPGYLVATSACAFVVLPLYAPVHYTLSSVAETLARNLQLQNWFVDERPFTRNPWFWVNGSLWTIPYEFGCYLGVLGLGAGGLLKTRFRVVIAMLLALSIGVHVLIDIVGREYSIRGPTVIPCFLAGMCFYLYRDLFNRNLAGALAAMLVLVWGTHLPGKGGLLALDILAPPVVAYGTFMLAFADRTYPAAAYGDLSYGTYLYAWPIQQMLKSSDSRLSFPVYVMLALALSVVAGMLSWYLIERWFRFPSTRPPEKLPHPRTLELPLNHA